MQQTGIAFLSGETFYKGNMEVQGDEARKEYYTCQVGSLLGLLSHDYAKWHCACVVLPSLKRIGERLGLYEGKPHGFKLDATAQDANAFMWLEHLKNRYPVLQIVPTRRGEDRAELVRACSPNRLPLLVQMERGPAHMPQERIAADVRLMQQLGASSAIFITHNNVKNPSIREVAYLHHRGYPCDYAAYNWNKERSEGLVRILREGFGSLPYYQRYLNENPGMGTGNAA